MQHFDSFKELKEWLISTWFPQNTKAVQLDGSNKNKSNMKVIVSFNTSEIPNLNAKISLHGDTKKEALSMLITSEIEDFIIIPPQKKAKYWRLHFKGTHEYENDSVANGLYAYLK
ncbi:hypothetical protein [Fluviispira multicolorata]|uniref:Uncharacterized protein n=1 Tax=Fluviispira multicolorata TaxID=2654512 RepID=A0A833N5A0_9BACT|nr:hypothetical protein [Fluviispira multicolorata]KAB8033607.1 hypothetical protein GCL57_02550 [Fluviispira multicolorata]